jgi:hypothetical protein
MGARLNIKGYSFSFAAFGWLCLQLFYTGAVAQVQTATPPAAPVLEHTFTDTIADFEVDNLGKIYLINANGRLKKLSEAYDSMGVFNDVRRYGNLQGADVSNPLKVLLFYKDFGTIVTLDRFLNVRSVLDLRQQGILQPAAITQSYDNFIWVYDELDNKVKKIDETGKILLESPDFRVVFEVPPQPVKLEDFNKYLYAYDPQLGLLIMDYFGAYRNLIALTGLKNLHGMQQGIVATNSNGLIYYKPGTIDTKSLPLPAEIIQATKLRVSQNKIFVLHPNGILKVYKLPESNLLYP